MAHQLHDGYGAIDGKYDGAYEPLRRDGVHLDVVNPGDQKVDLIRGEKIADVSVANARRLVRCDDIVMHRKRTTKVATLVIYGDLLCDPLKPVC